MFRLGPILDPSEFAARFAAHSRGSQPLGHEGSVISLLIVVWAAAYGIDERGVLMDELGFDRSASSSSLSDAGIPGPSSRSDSTPRSSSRTIRQLSRSRMGRRETIEPMIREILELVDYHGMLRRPSWDGVRVLLLLLPLMEGS